jgi:starvation-inducible DNA-binding protein
MAKDKPAREQTAYRTKIDFNPETRQKLISIVNQQLADTLDLYTQTKQAHWNVKGMEFQQLHELFDMVAAKVEPYIDILAERATTLGGIAMGTVRMSAANSSLSEYPLISDGRDHLEAVIDRFAAYTASNRDALRASDKLDDPTTADIFTDISRDVDLSLYFLESHLQR